MQGQGLSEMSLPGLGGGLVVKTGIRERRDRAEGGTPKPRVAPIRWTHHRQPLSPEGSTPCKASDQ